MNWRDMNCENAGWRDPEPSGRPYEGADAPGPYGTAWRTCNYCGSIHPDDVLALFRAGATADEADWKYGWPHKFYIKNAPNPLAGERVCDGGQSRDGVFTPHYSVGPEHAFVKFYTRHLAHATDFDALAAALLDRVPNVEWTRDEGGIKWRGYRGTGAK